MYEDETCKGERATVKKEPKVKDPRWLRIDICRDYVLKNCHKKQSECRFAHPTSACKVKNEKVTVCYDAMKGKCTRKNCRFFHPPLHIREYLLWFGKYLQHQRKWEERQLNPDTTEINHVPFANEEKHGLQTSLRGYRDGNCYVLPPQQQPFRQNSLDYSNEEVFVVFVPEMNMSPVNPTSNDPSLWNSSHSTMTYNHLANNFFPPNPSPNNLIGNPMGSQTYEATSNFCGCSDCTGRYVLVPTHCPSFVGPVSGVINIEPVAPNYVYPPTAGVPGILFHL